MITSWKHEIFFFEKFMKKKLNSNLKDWFRSSLDQNVLVDLF